ncbi:MAG: hypothetical protein QOF99_8838 [Pseudonocardiales bacterium]|nr:hypothetical protein [Pseudonocardiales bacterium]
MPPSLGSGRAAARSGSLLGHGGPDPSRTRPRAVPPARSVRRSAVLGSVVSRHLESIWRNQPCRSVDVVVFAPPR